MRIKKIKRIVFVVLALFVLYIFLAIFHTHKSLPAGVSYASPVYSVGSDDVDFLFDLTYADDKGELIHEQQIFDSIFNYIDTAEKYILIDMFLFNDYGAKTNSTYRKLADELTEKLINKKENNPEIIIDFITDPINIVYGGGESRQINELKQAGVNIIMTDLTKLRDSNFLYSAFWRLAFRFFGNSVGGWIKHPFSSEESKVSLRSYLTLLNFKANHRKVFVADDKDQTVTIITSANPHDGSSAHSNVALVVKGDFGETVNYTEKGVAKMSGAEITDYDFANRNSLTEKNKNIKIQLLTEGKIKRSVLNLINKAQQTDKIKIAQFYLSDRDIIKAFIGASKRGVKIQIILDPNKDAFGYEKNGIPNRQTARELIEKGTGNIEVRWYDTHGEQFHTKLFILESRESLDLVLGSANYTRRNLDDFNLETDVFASALLDTGLSKKVIKYYSRIWKNEDGNFTVAYEKYADSSFLKKIIYRIQEGLGLSSF